MPSETTRPARGHEPTTSERLRDRLRVETRPEHEALDAEFAEMLRPDAQDLYARFLMTNRAGHAALEPILLQSPLAHAQGGGWQAHGRLDALAADCTALGLPEWSGPAFAPGRPTFSQALGMAYVLEGSRLGAGFLLKALRRQDPASGLPVRYLEVSSDPEPFRRLLAMMNAHSPSKGEADSTIAAANGTFRYFRALAERARTRMTTS